MDKQELTIKGMTCMGCVNSVKKVLLTIPGVELVNVTLETGKVELSYDKRQASLSDLINAIEDAGYAVLT